MMTRKIRIDRVASSTANVHIGREAVTSEEIVCQDGYVLAVRILADKPNYNQVEDPTGRFMPLGEGDVLAGVLGSRRALRGYAGQVPDHLKVGDCINVLNLGGVLGHCTASNPELGPPFDAQVLGAILAFPKTGDRVGHPAHIHDHAVANASELKLHQPIIFVVGTCMDSGKTKAAAEIVRGLSRRGLRVGGVKLTGVALRRDTLAMLDAGAVAAFSFNDAGLVSTDESHVIPSAYGLLNELAVRSLPDVIVAEFGDGILGEYGVATLLADGKLTARHGAIVCCASDQVGAWGAVEVLASRFGLIPTVISGPVTDNEVGCRFIRNELGLPAHNARRDGAGLVDCVSEALDARTC
jgi:hypothetical protein